MSGNFEKAIEDRVQALTKMVQLSTHISEEQREELLTHMANLAEKVSNKPMSLGDLSGTVSGNHLAGFDTTSIEELRRGAADPIEFDDEAIKHWKTLCWRARFDMSEQEMLLLSEKTMKTLLHAYGHPAPVVALSYWKFLVRRYAEIEKTEAARGLQPKACGGGGGTTTVGGSQNGSFRKERHAGAVVASGTMVSQRSEALPEGITEGSYKPEVASPTAAMWKEGPRAPDGGSFRRSEGSGSPSTYGSRSIANTRSMAARSFANPASVREGSGKVEHKSGWAR